MGAAVHHWFVTKGANAFLCMAFLTNIYSDLFLEIIWILGFYVGSTRAMANLASSIF
jgi:hypothetical protein